MSWQTHAAQIAAVARSRPPGLGHTRVVALEGRSGAGKTTLAPLVARALGDAPLVSMEDLYGGWDGLRDGAERLVDAVLEPLAREGHALVPAFDWHARRWGPAWELAAPEVLVVDGIGSGTRAAAQRTSLLVWLDCDDAVRRERALARDGGLYDPYWDRWAAQEDAYLAEEDPRTRADLRLPADPGSPAAP